MPDTYEQTTDGEEEEWFGTIYTCSNCGSTMIGKSKYCHDCGVKFSDIEEA